ncbi:OLC1v1011702C1 [Oldenlandia corymbosa var. corymbosa]|uniref:OLC1v1011702C1 n=1 Tax=Oldenlandia corymbosa var. corymbosa TaxID=529605 RepID=A0AAV1DUF9_OLDCO|nr:OLC1v1011702C1 [Oldenlandia corymbosa var. corymbosa]
MGVSKKHSGESGGKKEWVIAGITIRAPLKSIRTKPTQRDEYYNEDAENEGRSNSSSTTPTARDSRIPEKLPCPPPPRKRRPAQTCHFNGVREFFNPPDLESVFVVRHVET